MLWTYEPHTYTYTHSKTHSRIQIFEHTQIQIHTQTHWNTLTHFLTYVHTHLHTHISKHFLHGGGLSTRPDTNSTRVHIFIENMYVRAVAVHFFLWPRKEAFCDSFAWIGEKNYPRNAHSHRPTAQIHTHTHYYARDFPTDYNTLPACSLSLAPSPPPPPPFFFFYSLPPRLHFFARTEIFHNCSFPKPLPTTTKHHSILIHKKALCSAVPTAAAGSWRESGKDTVMAKLVNGHH